MSYQEITFDYKKHKFLISETAESSIYNVYQLFSNCWEPIAGIHSSSIGFTCCPPYNSGDRRAYTGKTLEGCVKIMLDGYYPEVSK